jgi:peptide/nickel transport system permease protein
MTLPLKNSEKITMPDPNQRFWWRWRKHLMRPSMIFGIVVVVVLCICAILGLLWTPYDPNKQNFALQLSPPTLAHPLGTDHFGRDTLSRLLKGASISLFVGVVSVGIGASIGIVLGVLAGYIGKLLDDLVMRVLDALSAFPTILLALLLATIMRPGLWSAMLAVGLASVPTFARLARAGVLSVKNLDYIESARALGVAESRLMWRHILPNIVAPLLVQATFGFAVAILAEASLSYLGLGQQPPNPSWGVMLQDARSYIDRSAWPTMMPGIVIIVTVLGLNLLGDGLRDALDPKT